MVIEQLEKVLVRYDPVRGGSVVQGRLPPTSVHDPSKRGADDFGELRTELAGNSRGVKCLYRAARMRTARQC